MAQQQEELARTSAVHVQRERVEVRHRQKGESELTRLLLESDSAAVESGLGTKPEDYGATSDKTGAHAKANTGKRAAKEEGNALPVSVLLTVVATLGVGVLTLPYSFRAIGLIPGLIMLPLLGFLMTWQNTITVECVDLLPSTQPILMRSSYGNLSSHLLSRNMTLLTQIVLCLQTLGAVLAFSVTVAQMMSALISVRVLNHSGENDNFAVAFLRSLEKDEYLYPFFVLVFCFVIVFPLSLVKNMAALRYSSFLGTFCVVYLCIAVIYEYFDACVMNASAFEDENNEGIPSCFDPLSTVNWWPTGESPFEIILALTEVVSLYVFSFVCCQNILEIYGELKAHNFFYTKNPSAPFQMFSPAQTTPIPITITEPQNNSPQTLALAPPMIRKSKGKSSIGSSPVEQRLAAMKPSMGNLSDLPKSPFTTMKRVLVYGTICTGFVYMLVAVFGYVRFGENTCGNIMLNDFRVPNASDNEARVSIMLIAIVTQSVFVSIAAPLYVYSFRINVLGLVSDIKGTRQMGHDSDTDSDTAAAATSTEPQSAGIWHVLIPFILMCFCALFSIIFSNMIFVFSLMGSTTYPFLAFILPTAFYRIVSRQRAMRDPVIARRRKLTTILTVCISISSLLSFCWKVYTVSTGQMASGC